MMAGAADIHINRDATPLGIKAKCRGKSNSTATTLMDRSVVIRFRMFGRPYPETQERSRYTHNFSDGVFVACCRGRQLPPPPPRIELSQDEQLSNLVFDTLFCIPLVRCRFTE